ncbi:hypothetical protein [Flavobacterium suncheonense]|uniref:hypothetical protein n=1 Tax=Flavobacterium suncheonense TaxID=350894 RepID=UPI003FA3D152
MKIKCLMFSIITIAILFSCKTNAIKGVEVKKELNYIPYYLKVYEADSLYITKNYQRSYDILDSLFQKYEPLNMPSYYEVNRYYQLKIILDKKIKNEDFLKLISKYRLTDTTLKKDSIFNIYYLKEKNFFDKNYAKLSEINKSSLKLELRKEISLMIENDQLYRKQSYHANIDKQNTIDSINSKRLIEIFNDYGFPDEKIIGNSLVDGKIVDVGVLLLHTKDSLRINYFLPKIMDFIKEGKAKSQYYANMYDQYLLYKGQEQYYGSYDNKTQIPIKELNRRRATIGLPNYGYEKWRINKLFPKH